MHEKPSINDGENKPLGFFLRNVAPLSETLLTPTNNPSLYKELEGLSHYRLIPGLYPQGMKYHFDGLAAVLKFDFKSDGKVSMQVKHYNSDAYTDYKDCILFASVSEGVGYHVFIMYSTLY